MVPYKVKIYAVLIAFVVGNAVFGLPTLSLPVIATQNPQMSPSRMFTPSAIFSLGSRALEVLRTESNSLNNPRHSMNTCIES